MGIKICNVKGHGHTVNIFKLKAKYWSYEVDFQFPAHNNRGEQMLPLHSGSNVKVEEQMEVNHNIILSYFSDVSLAKALRHVINKNVKVHYVLF